MKRKLQSTTSMTKSNKVMTNKQRKTLNTVYKVVTPIAFIGIFFLIWQSVCWSGLVPKVMLPTPVDTVKAFINSFDLIAMHTQATLIEAVCGLLGGIVIGFLIALLMDAFKLFCFGFKPLLVISQTIPTIVIAPLFVLWLGYGLAPKILLVCLTTFFPIAIGLADGYRNTDQDMIDLMRSMGANKVKIFWFLKLPNALPNFFSSLKISATYSIVGAVIAEWVGAKSGLGFYILRAQRMFAYDVMFAIIFWVIMLSLLLMLLVEILKKLIIRWDKKEK